MEIFALRLLVICHEGLKAPLNIFELSEGDGFKCIDLGYIRFVELRTMIQACHPTQIERARSILVGALKNSLGVHWVLRDKSEAGKVMALEVLFFEGADKEGIFLSDDGNGALVFYDINDSSWSWSNVRRKAKLVLRHAGIRSLWRLSKYRQMISSTRPRKAMVGFLVGTDRLANGTKAIFDIHEGMQKLAKSQNLPICLETTQPRVRRLYQYAGYAEYAVKKHPYAELDIYFFIKYPEDA